MLLPFITISIQKCYNEIRKAFIVLVKYRFSLKKGGTGYAACILGAV
jgi:hypothetical protein